MIKEKSPAIQALDLEIKTIGRMIERLDLHSKTSSPAVTDKLNERQISLLCQAIMKAKDPILIWMILDLAVPDVRRRLSQVSNIDNKLS